MLASSEVFGFLDCAHLEIHTITKIEGIYYKNVSRESG
jgi:hypothetical protein